MLLTSLRKRDLSVISIKEEDNMVMVSYIGWYKNGDSIFNTNWTCLTIKTVSKSIFS